MRRFKFEETVSGVVASSVQVGNDVLLQGGDGRMNIEVANAAGGSTLTAFSIQVRAHHNGTFGDRLSGTDFDTATKDMIYCDTPGPHELPAGSSCRINLDLGPLDAIRFMVTGAASPESTVTVRGIATGG